MTRLGGTGGAPQSSPNNSSTKGSRKVNTQDVLASMLTERTGTSILDSGGSPKYDANGKYIGSQYGYGRSWERNQGMTVAMWEAHDPISKEVRCSKDGEDLEVPIADLKPGEVNWTASTYHWLKDKLDYREDWQLIYDTWVRLFSNRHQSDLTDMEEFCVWLKERGCEVGGIYGEGDPVTENSYNGECLLSTTIQFMLAQVEPPYSDGAHIVWTGYEIPEDEDPVLGDELPTEWPIGGSLVLLQIHGGADVRGGYTAPKIFDEKEECSMCFSADLSVGDGDHIWDSDNAGYSWYPGHNKRVEPGREVRDLQECVILDEEDATKRFEAELGPLADYPRVYPEESALPGMEEVHEERLAQGTTDRDVLAVWMASQGAMLYDKEEQLHCPICGQALYAMAR